MFERWRYMTKGEYYGFFYDADTRTIQVTKQRKRLNGNWTRPKRVKSIPVEILVAFAHDANMAINCRPDLLPCLRQRACVHEANPVVYRKDVPLDWEV